MRRIDLAPDSRYGRLFQSAMSIIDSVKTRFDVEVDWRWGGGTVMMLRHRHRESNDIDVFIDDPQILGCLNPGLNDTVGALTDLYDQQAKFIKLYLPPDGEVDFVVSSRPDEHPDGPRTIREGPGAGCYP